MADSISWLKIASGTAKPRFSADTIQRWFREADRANRLQTPDIDTCQKVSMRLMELLSLSAAPVPPAGLTRSDVRSLCDAAKRAWDNASRYTRKVTFSWRGKNYRSTLTNFRMIVLSARGEPICERYH
jgi:hypothetical protein